MNNVNVRIIRGEDLSNNSNDRIIKLLTDKNINNDFSTVKILAKSIIRKDIAKILSNIGSESNIFNILDNIFSVISIDNLYTIISKTPEADTKKIKELISLLYYNEIFIAVYDIGSDDFQNKYSDMVLNELYIMSDKIYTLLERF